MLALRAAIAVVVIAGSTLAANATCVSSVPLLRPVSLSPALRPGPVAWNGSFLAAASWEEPSNAIWITIYGQDGVEIVPPRKVVETSIIGPTALVWNGMDFGLFYRSNGTLYLQRIEAGGTPSGDPIPIETSRSVYPGDATDVTWSDAFGAYVLGRRVGGGTPSVYGTVLTREGIVTREELLDVAHVASPVRLAVTGGGVAGFFFYAPDDTLHLSRMVAGEPPSLAGLDAEGGEFVVAANGEELVLLQERELLDGTSSIFYSSFDAAGDVVRAEMELVNNGGDLRPLAASVRDGEIALAYLDVPDGFDEEAGEYRLHRFAADGSPIADTLFAAANTSRARSFSSFPFVWTGSTYLNLVPRIFADGEATYLVRLCPLTASIAAPGVVRVGTPVSFAALIDGGVPEYSQEWSFGDRNFSNDEEPQHEYDETGTYTVTLEVVDESGTEVVYEFEIRVVDGKRRAVGHR